MFLIVGVTCTIDLEVLQQTNKLSILLLGKLTFGFVKDPSVSPALLAKAFAAIPLPLADL